jgi:RimJ/RimL family protein N-acetyltransferase
MELQLRNSRLRSWEDRDAEALSQYGDSHAVWRNMRDAFPKPFTLERAREFIAAALAARPETRLAIDVDGEAVGSIGVSLHTDIERVSAEMGYWLGEPFWGRGIMTEVVEAMTRHCVETFNLTRVYAVPFETSTASARVLEKAGFVLEGRMRRCAIKEGRVIDQLLYAYVPETLAPR